MAASVASIGNLALSPSEFMVSFINSHFDDNVRSLSKLQDVYKEVKDQRSAIESRVNESSYFNIRQFLMRILYLVSSSYLIKVN